MEDNGELEIRQGSLLLGHTPHRVTYKLRKRLRPIWSSVVLPRECFLGERDDQDTGCFRRVGALSLRINRFLPTIWVGLGSYRTSNPERATSSAL